MSAPRFFARALVACALVSCSSDPVANDAPVDAGLPPALDAAMVDAPPAGDSLPMGVISFFNRQSCPVGWQPFAAGGGRSVVPSIGADVGTTAGPPLADAEDRPHGHTVSANLNLPSVDYAGIAGEANHGVARAGSPPLTMTFNQASAGLPYVQLLICQKTAAPITTRGLAPAGTLMFFATPDCPSGWGQTATTAGRFLVGLPAGGTANQSFGGAPLVNGPQGDGEQRAHVHNASGTITTNAHGIALLSGGAAGGYAKDDKHPYQATSDSGAVDFPYIQLLQCQKL